MKCPKCGYIFTPIETGEPCPQCDWVELGIRPREPEWKLRARQPSRPPIDTSRPIYGTMMLLGLFVGPVIGLLLENYLVSQYPLAAELNDISWYYHDANWSLLDLVTVVPCFLLGVYAGHLVGGLLAGRRHVKDGTEQEPPVPTDHPPVA